MGEPWRTDGFNLLGEIKEPLNVTLESGGPDGEMAEGLQRQGYVHTQMPGFVWNGRSLWGQPEAGFE